MASAADQFRHRRYLEGCLASAVVSMRMSRVQCAAIDATRRAILFSVLLFPLNGLAVFLSRANLLPHRVAFVCAVVSLLALGAMVVRSTMATWLKTPSYAEAAERIDLAADNHNRLSTALDLSQRTHPESHFVNAAIADALAHLKADTAVIPQMPAGQIKLNQSGAILLLGFALIIACMFVPVSFFAQGELLNGENKPATLLAVSAPILPEINLLKPALKPNSLSGQQAAKSDDSPSAGAAAPSKENRSNSGAVDSTNNSAGTSSLANSAGNKAEINSHSNANAQSASHTIADNASSASSASMQNVSGVMGNSSDASAASVGKGDMQSQTALDHPAASNSPTPASRAEGSSSSPTGQSANSPGGQGSGGSGAGQGGSGKSAGKGGGESMESVGGTANRNGPPSGKTPSKKSRGTMSEILTQRQPDLIKGPELPGSDERTEMEIPPQHTLGVPADSSATANPGGSEIEVSRYWVPPDARGIAAEYFTRFHTQDGN